MNPGRCMKLQEFPAHASNVNCASIGRKTLGVLATGGDDQCVNLWILGTAQRTLSLSGHTSPVESVTFNQSDEKVAAGSASGSIRIWDLEQATSARSLPGHKCNVQCLHFSSHHLVSGAGDCQAKIWDLRTRDPVRTLKGHGAPVLHVQLSPDELWLASADQSGAVKVWDLAADRLRHDLKGHTHAVTGLQMHPNEMLLATCSRDKTVKIWDVEVGQLLQSTPAETTGVRAIAFHPDQQYIFSATQDGLRVWEYEPSPIKQLDSVDVGWTKVHDMVITPDKDKIMGCSYHGPFVGLWAVYLNQVAPFSGQPAGRVRQSSNSRQEAPSVGDSASSRGGQGANLHDYALRRGGQVSPAAYGANALPPQPAVHVNRRPSPVQQHLEPQLQNLRISDDRRRSGGQAEAPPSVPQSTAPPVPAARKPSPSERTPPSSSSSHPAAPLPRSHRRSTDPTDPAPSPPTQLPPPPQAPHMVSVGVGVGDSLLRGHTPPGALQQLAQQAAAVEQQRQPWEAGVPGGRGGADPLGDCIRGSDKVMEVMGLRQSTMQRLKSMVVKGDIKGVLQCGRRAQDSVAVADMLTALQQRRGMLEAVDMSCVPELVPLLEQAMTSKTERHVQAAVEWGLFVCKSLGPTIREVCGAAKDGKRLAVDVAFEQRKGRCETARMVLEGLRGKVSHLTRQHARSQGPLYQQLLDLSEQLAATCGG